MHGSFGCLFGRCLVFLLLLSWTTIGLSAQTMPQPLHILGIGNSYTEDMLWDLPEILAEDSASIDLHFIFVAGGALDDHASLMDSDAPKYCHFHYSNASAEWQSDTVCYSQIIKLHDWNIITLQQSSQYSGRYSNIKRWLPPVLDHLQLDCPEASLFWHFTWAYPQGSTHPGFANYDHSQQKMYHDVATVAYNLTQKDFSSYFTGLIPTGAVIQTLRDSTQIVTTGDFCRDFQHLDLTIGRYAASCTFYEAVLAPYTSRSVFDLDYIPANDSLRSAADYQQVRKIVYQLVHDPSIIWNSIDLDLVYRTLGYDLQGRLLGVPPGPRPYILRDFFTSGRKKGRIVLRSAR